MTCTPSHLVESDFFSVLPEFLTHFEGTREKIRWEMAVHMAHPSVRMKGTEIDWTPMQCVDSACTHAMKGPHLHCPFCTQESLFTDQVLLKAHYRVKHVDKAIEFAGLKILRCCRSCDVHGIIHERKHFKGAHWHCYHCRNGFNRRDEAVKHYRQHFRHPQTTIQIVIAQDVNQTMSTYPNAVPNSTSLVTHFIMPQSHQPVESGTPTGCGQNGDQQVQYQYAYSTNDHSHSSDNGEETVVLIEIPDEGNKEDLEGETCYTEHSGINLSLLLQDKERLEKTLLEERTKWAQTEQRMKGTIERLRAKVEYLSNTNAALKQQLTVMQTSSLKRLTHDSDHSSILEELVQHMSEEHTQLLHHHLAQLRLYAEAQELSKRVQEDSTSREEQGMVPDLGIQSEDISGMTMMSSESTLENMEQTVVMTITSEEDSQSLDDIVESQEDSAEQDSLSLEKDVQMPSTDSSYQLTTGELLPKTNSSGSRPMYQSDGSHSPHNGVCDVTRQEFDKDKSLKLILSDSTPKIFCADGLEKRAFDGDASGDAPPSKRGRRTASFKAS